MAILKKNKRALRITLWVVLFLALCFVGLHLSFVLYFNGRIKRELQQEFRVQTGGEYELLIKKLNTNIFARSVFISDFKVVPVKGIRPEATKYHISASRIRFENFKLFAFLSRKDLEFYSLELTDPKMMVYRNRVEDGPDSGSKDKSEFSLYRLLKKHIHGLSVANIRVDNAVIEVYADDRDSVLLLHSKDNELNISGLRIDEESERYGRLFLAEKTELVVRKFSFNIADSLYTIKVARVVASYTDSTVYMDSVSLLPNYSKKHFARMAGEQIDRFRISIPKVEFRRMDVKLFFEKNWFIARQLKISGLNLEAYRDKNDARKPHAARSIQSLLKDIPVRVKIDSIIVKNANCVYEEVAEEKTEPGKIQFNHIDAVILGFVNRFPGDQDVLSLKATCRLMNSGKLRVYYGFPLNTEKMVFDCSGHLYGMPFTEINKVLEPIARVSALQGQIDSMIFSFHAGDISSEGTMKLAYHDLKIQILKKKDGMRDPAEHLLSFLAHSFVIKEQNPTGNRDIRIARIHYRRDPERFIFNYSLKSLLSGIKETIGLPKGKGDR
jgi:hypothetical protein